MDACCREKTMLMLLERVEKLSEEVHLLRTCMANNMLTIPDTKSYAELDFSKAAFVRVRLDSKDLVEEIIHVLRNITNVQAFIYDVRPTHEFCSAFSNDNIPYMPHGTITLQALLYCKQSMVLSHVEEQLRNAFDETQMCQVELQPIVDLTAMFKGFSTDQGLFRFYYHHITSAKYGIAPDEITERKIEWMKHDGTVYVHDFMGNALNSHDYESICEFIENNNMHVKVFPWSKKV